MIRRIRRFVRKIKRNLRYKGIDLDKIKISTKEWKLVLGIYFPSYFLFSLILRLATGKGSVWVIALIGLIIPAPYIYWVFKTREPRKFPDEPDIQNLY